MRAGKLRHRVTIQALVAGSPQQDAGGEPDNAWTEVKTVHASVDPLKGRELIAAQQTASEVTGIIKIRYRSGIDSSMRCVFGSKIYDILAVVDPEERHIELWLYVREGVNRG